MTLSQVFYKHHDGGAGMEHSPGFIVNHVLNCTSNNDSLPNGWCLELDSQTPRYIRDASISKVNQSTIPIVTIQHYTHKGYEKCLAGKTIVFIGDSRVRFQYLNLAHFLMSSPSGFMRCSDHPTRCNGLLHPDQACYLIGVNAEKLKVWHKASTNLLNSTDQLHLCDCYRHIPFRPNIELTTENRFIKQYTQFGEIKLIYLQSFVDKVTMNQDFPPYSSFLPDGTNKNRCEVGDCSPNKRTVVFTGTVNDTVWNILPRLNTTHAFVNFGWREEDDEKQTKQSAISCTLKDFNKHHSNIMTQLITTPPSKEYISNTANYFDISKLECNCNVFDRTTMTKDVPLDWYFDNVHVLGVLNEEYNHRLIKSICPMF